MTIIEASSDIDDGIKLLWTNAEHGDTYEVTVLIGYDGVTLVQVDTPSNVGRIRIALNDGVVWDGDPDKDVAPGEYGAEWIRKHS